MTFSQFDELCTDEKVNFLFRIAENNAMAFASVPATVATRFDTEHKLLQDIIAELGKFLFPEPNTEKICGYGDRLKAIQDTLRNLTKQLLISPYYDMNKYEISVYASLTAIDHFLDFIQWCFIFQIPDIAFAEIYRMLFYDSLGFNKEKKIDLAEWEHFEALGMGTMGPNRPWGDMQS